MPGRQVPAGRIAYDTPANYERLRRVIEPIALANAVLCRETSIGVMTTPDGREACAISAGVAKGYALNAWTDGTNIFITPTMLAFVRSDDELAFVFCHELAHVMRGHVADKIPYVVAGAVLDGAAASQGVNTGGAFQALGGIVFNKDREREADRVGAYLMARAGFDPRAGSAFWSRMPASGGGWFATHPANDDRSADLSRVSSDIEVKRGVGAALFPPR